ncbi:MAG: hypothetical protein NT091_02640, partial [Candidatus Falkowbacteria bacterium]|nr:hypothetical protein [Candidatus Falkowbacteria bacterium]
ITGPVEVNDVNYDKDNFVRLYEQELDKAYADAGKYTAKKLLIGEISRAVQIKLATIPFSSWPELGSVLSKNADAKNILIYSKDPAIEKLLAEQNWAGELKKTANDYLMVVDSNVPAVRLNKDVDESVNYEVVKAGDSLKAKLTVKYTYVKNQETKSYKNYVRVY